jgi:hypothetical protein
VAAAGGELDASERSIGRQDARGQETGEVWGAVDVPRLKLGPLATAVGKPRKACMLKPLPRYGTDVASDDASARVGARASAQPSHVRAGAEGGERGEDGGEALSGGGAETNKKEMGVAEGGDGRAWQGALGGPLRVVSKPANTASKCSAIKGAWRSYTCSQVQQWSRDSLIHGEGECDAKTRFWNLAAPSSAKPDPVACCKAPATETPAPPPSTPSPHVWPAAVQDPAYGVQMALSMPMSLSEFQGRQVSPRHARERETHTNTQARAPLGVHEYSRYCAHANNRRHSRRL